MPKPTKKSSPRSPSKSQKSVPQSDFPYARAWAKNEKAALDAAKLPPKLERLNKWLKEVTPDWNWDYKYLVYIQEHLEKVTTGEITRLILNVPPRHGKSEQTTVRYPIYRLEADPKFRIIVGAYSQTLANKFSRKMRKIARAIELKHKQEALLKRIGRYLRLSRESSRVDDWETTEGGGVRVVGVGGGVTGMGANLIVIDDPVKSRKEANSPVYREAVWDWYTDDVRTRLEPGGAIIVIMTRWHEDDLAGRLIAEMAGGGEQWVVINLPALAEENDVLGRAEGEALCPERYDVTALESLMRVLKANFFALFQGRPRPADGGFFKRQWFDKVIARERLPLDLKWFCYFDGALSTKDGADNSAMCDVALGRDGTLYIKDMWADQKEWPDARRILKARMLANPAVSYGIEEKMHGLAAVQELQRDPDLAHINFRGVGVDGDKQARALPWQARAEAEKVVLVEGDWINDFLLEIAAFPGGKHDDRIDTVSGGCAMIAGSGKWTDDLESMLRALGLSLTGNENGILEPLETPAQTEDENAGDRTLGAMEALLNSQ